MPHSPSDYSIPLSEGMTLEKCKQIAEKIFRSLQFQLILLRFGRRQLSLSRVRDSIKHVKLSMNLRLKSKRMKYK